MKNPNSPSLLRRYLPSFLRAAFTRRRRGATLAYVTIAIPVMVGFCALGIDVGRLQVAKSELQSVADAAARYGALGIRNSSTPASAALANAQSVVSQAKVDGAAPTLANADVKVGTWSTTSRTFTSGATGDVVRVTVKQKLNRPGTAPLMISLFTGNSQTEIVATATARNMTLYSTVDPPAAGNLWLAGMADNTTNKNFQSNSTVWDNSGTPSNPKQRPLELDLSAVNLSPGDTIRLEGITGTASWVSGGSSNNADGDSTYLVANGVAPASSAPTNSNNGMSNTRAPIGAVMAVFLTDNPPSSGSTPANLDFGSSSARDYSSISPKVKQVFFVGDGQRTDGTVQTIVIPSGATRLFLGTMDAWQWNDNTGNFQAKLYAGNETQLLQ